MCVTTTVETQRNPFMPVFFFLSFYQSCLTLRAHRVKLLPIIQILTDCSIVGNIRGLQRRNSKNSLYLHLSSLSDATNQGPKYTRYITVLRSKYF